MHFPPVSAGAMASTNPQETVAASAGHGEERAVRAEELLGEVFFPGDEAGELYGSQWQEEQLEAARRAALATQEQPSAGEFPPPFPQQRRTPSVTPEELKEKRRRKAQRAFGPDGTHAPPIMPGAPEAAPAAGQAAGQAAGRAEGAPLAPSASATQFGPRPGARPRAGPSPRGRAPPARTGMSPSRGRSPESPQSSASLGRSPARRRRRSSGSPDPKRRAAPLPSSGRAGGRSPRGGPREAKGPRSPLRDDRSAGVAQGGPRGAPAARPTGGEQRPVPSSAQASGAGPPRPQGQARNPEPAQ